MKDMDKGMIRTIIVAAAVLLVYLMLVLLIPFVKTAVYWVAFVFGLIAIAAQAVIMKRAFLDGESIKSKFYGFPIARLGVIYLVAQMVVTFGSMALSQWIPMWVVVLLCGLLICFAAIGLIAADAVREQIEVQDAKLKKDVAMMQGLISQAAHLVGLCENAEMKKVVQKLADAFRYSDPVTAAPLAEMENELKVQLDELQKAILDGDQESVQTLCRQTSNTLAERNRLCKLGKKDRQ